jgi:hypothetical protein
MKKQFVGIILIALALMLSGTGASADVIEQFDLDFSSGANFTGLVTFTDTFDAVVAVNGILTGSLYGPSPDAITTVWFGTPTPVQLGSIVNVDFLMGTPFGSGLYQEWIEIDWNTTTHALDNTAGSFYGLGYLPNAINSVDQVPEPAALFLLGPGLIGLAAVRRRFTK